MVPFVAIAQAINEGLEGTPIEQAITTAAARGLLGRLSEARLRVAAADRHCQVPHRPIR